MDFILLFDKKWIKILFNVLPTGWFTYFSIFGTSQELLYKNEHLTTFSIIISIVMIFAWVFHTVIAIMLEHYKSEQKINSERVFNTVLYSIDDVSIFTKNKQIDALCDAENVNTKSDYKSSVLVLLSSLIQCLSDITDIPKEMFVATYFYKFDDWAMISSDGVYKGLGFDSLSKGESVFSQLLKDDATIFYESKEQAAANKKYMCDLRDAQEKEMFGRPMGSIIGANWNIINPMDESKKFENIITIATYGVEICNNDDLKTKYILLGRVMKIFGHQFNLLALNYGKIDSLV